MYFKSVDTAENTGSLTDTTIVYRNLYWSINLHADIIFTARC